LTLGYFTLPRQGMLVTADIPVQTFKDRAELWVLKDRNDPAARAYGILA